MSNPFPTYPPSSFVQTPHSSPAITTVTSDLPSSTSASVPNSPSDVKAIIAGSVVGGFLGCCLVFILVYWLCRQRHNRSRASRAEVVPAGIVDGTREPESFFGLSYLGFRSKQTQVRRKESKSSKNVLVSSPSRRRPSLPVSMNGHTVPKNIPMVHSRSPYSRPPQNSSGRSRSSSLWRRGSTDEAKDVKPPPYQYGVVGSRRPSVSTPPPSPGGYPSTSGQAHGEPGWRPEPAHDGLTAALIQYLNQDTPSSPTSPTLSFPPSNVGQGSLSSSNPPLTMQPRNQAGPPMQQIPSEFGYGSVSGSADSGSGSKHSNSGLLNTFSRESRDRHVSLPPPLPTPSRTHPRPWDHRPSYSTHRDRQSRSDEGHSPPTSFHVSSTSSRSTLQRSQSTGGDSSGTLVSRDHHPRRVYDQRPRSGGSVIPPPSAFPFSSLGPTDVSLSSNGTDDTDDPQVRRKGKAVGPTPASRRTSPPTSRASSQRTPREPRPPSPPDLVLEEIAALARDARLVENRLSRISGSDWDRGRFDSEEGPKVLVLRNG